MRKLLPILIFICSVSFAKAQYQYKNTQLSFWLHGGVNYATLFQSTGSGTNVTGIFTPEGGFSMRAVFPTMWGFETGVLYSQRGGNFKDSGYKAILDYVGAYWDGILYFPLQNNDDAYAGMGIFAMQAFDGRYKFDGSAGENEKVTFGNTWKRFDMGLEIKGGYVIKNIITLGLKYNIGVFNTFNTVDYSGDVFGRNSVLTASVGIRLLKMEMK